MLVGDQQPSIHRGLVHRRATSTPSLEETGGKHDDSVSIDSNKDRPGVIKSLLGKVGGLLKREPPQREWTVIYYANGNSDLEAREFEKLYRLGEPGSSKTTTFVAQISSGQQGGEGQRCEVRPKSWGDGTVGHRDIQTQERLGKTNMGSAETFKDALLWAHEKYPAKHYMVIVGGHGEGPRGGLHDDIHGERLSVNDMHQGLEALKEARGGKSTEVMVADSCLLGAGEIGYQFRDSAEYYVASEEVIQTSDLGFRKLGKGMRKKGLDARQAAELVMDSADPLTRTLSMVDLSKMGEVGRAVGQLNRAVEASPGDRLRLNELALKTQNFMRDDSLPEEHPFKSYRDLGHFAQLVREDKGLQNEALRKAADGVFKAVGEAVVRNQTGRGYENATGMSMNIAAGGEVGPGEYYADLALSQDSGWSGKL